MSTSRLNKEDDQFLYLSCYLHNDPDEYPEWAFDGRNKLFPQEIIEADHFALYEVKVNYRIRKSDGEVFLDGVS